MKPNENPTPAANPAAGLNSVKKKWYELAQWAKADLDFARSEFRSIFRDKYVLAALIIAAGIVASLIALPFLSPGY
jgi:hypothetical protein